MAWLDELQFPAETDEPTTKAQRRAMYRLGLSRHFVHAHVKTKAQASDLIGVMIKQHGKLREEANEETVIDGLLCVGSV